MCEYSGIGLLLAGFFVFGFGGLIFEVILDEWCADTLFSECADVERASKCLGSSDDGVSYTNFGRWFRDGAVKADGGAATGVGGIGACLINADCPKPFVDARVARWLMTDG